MRDETDVRDDLTHNSPTEGGQRGVRAHHPILDATAAEQAARQTFGPWLDAGRDLAAYSADLFRRALRSNSGSFTPVIVVGNIFRQGLVAFDGALLCFEHGAVDAAWPLVRQLTEASFALDWMLLSDPDHWARMYYVSSVRHNRLAALRVTPGTPEHETFDDALQTIGGATRTARRLAKTGAVERAIKEAERLLASPEWKTYNQLFEKSLNERQRKNRQPFEPEWYEPGGVPSLHAMAKAINRRAEYVTIYHWASQYAHGTSSWNHTKVVEPGKVGFEPVRHLRAFFEPYGYAIGGQVRMVQRITETYRAGELPQFRQAYAERWRDAYLSRPKIVSETEYSPV